MKRKDLDMTVGTPWRLLVAFAAPMLLSLLFQQMYNMVDTLVVGRFVGKTALAATGCTSHVLNLIIGLFTGFSMGTNVVVSQYFGAHDDLSVHDSVHTSLTVGLAASIVLSAVGILLSPRMLTWMNVPDDVIGQASAYLRIYFIGAPANMIYNMSAGILRAVGDSKRPLYFLIFSSIVNIILDLLFVVVFHLGVPGVAWATTISQVLSAVLAIATLSRAHGAYRLVWSDFKVNPPILRQTVRIGLPSSIQMAITAFSNVFVQSYINVFGSAFMAANSAFGKIDQIALLPAQSLSNAATTFVGQNMGAGQVGRAKGGVRTAMLLATSCTVVLLIPLIFAAGPILSIFNKEADVLYYGVRLMQTVSPFYIVNCVNQIYTGSLRGAGNTRVPTVITLSSFVVFRQIYLFVMSRLIPGNYMVMILAYPVGWCLCTLIMTIYYRTSDWAKYGTITGVEQKD